MLDQNTDRMWYVIGAIVIGAAIIAMGLNIFSESLGSVDSLMTSQLESTGDFITYNYGNKLKSSDMYFQYIDVEPGGSLSEIRIKDNSPFGNYNGIYFHHDALNLKADTDYVFRYDYILNGGVLETFGGHFGLVSSTPNKVYVNGVLNSNRYVNNDSALIRGDSVIPGELYSVEVHFKTNSDESNIFNQSAEYIHQSIAIQPNRGIIQGYDVTLKNIGLFEVSN